MSGELCRLCLAGSAIERSHVIPAFVFRAIKSDSPSGFLRNAEEPNRRIQDGDKLPLLCGACEQRFAGAEREFCEKVFLPFHHTDRDHFMYGPWLHYFMTSLAWRTLVLDLPGMQSDTNNPRCAVEQMVVSVDTMRRYLLGGYSLGAGIRNHVILWTGAHSGSDRLRDARVNTTIRRSAFGCSFIEQVHGYSGVVNNLAGFMCFSIVKGNPRDTWSNTRVLQSGGELRQPQRVRSWFVGQLLQLVAENRENYSRVSKNQRDKIRQEINKNPNAAGLRFRRLDEKFTSTES